ncbi:MAG: threonine ammonia-lyase [Candidatus Tectomicrobia bacterium]|uniref:Threonine ammonia-lyase n=1 Tax=Tectimicrobiota bacterium TaxID=2528274 RepID=A0A932M193_UNCTE|nr:threonine ammonia-lyase [Candidatus Tectomicrobia bacterium]
MLSLQDIERARAVLADAIDVTPLVFSRSLSEMTGCQVYLKMENLQKTGSFKVRGAYTKMSGLSAAERKAGVFAASAGNHAQGVAYAARKFRVRSTIVMPQSSAIAKLLATQSYGARTVLWGQSFEDAFRRARELARQKKGTFIHAFDDYAVMAGQGTIALEILDVLSQVDAVLVPVGGGGLLAGISTALKETRPRIRVLGVEAAGAASLAFSRREGHRVILSRVHTLADGIALKSVGRLTYPILEKYVDDVVTVQEDSIARAITLLLERKKVVVEGAGAVPLAALLEGVSSLRGKRVVLILSGGNIDVTLLDRIIEKGLVTSGRCMRLEVELQDIPGALSRLTQLIADARANILHVSHDRLSQDVPIGSTKVDLALETRGDDHMQEVLKILTRKGYSAVLLGSGRDARRGP